jgi:hypothetical protein
MQRNVLALLLGASVAIGACGIDPRKPFHRMSPEVDRAIAELDAGAHDAATGRLSRYLAATECDGGTLVAPGARDAESAAFDLGLSLFALAEQFGKRFGEPDLTRDGGPTPEEEHLYELRKEEVDCARALLDQVLSQPLSPDLEARARYLRGNLAYLARRWKDAVEDYDRALIVIPGIEGDAGDGIGRDAAWNRALALRNDEEDKKKDAGPDASDDASQDADSGQDAADDSGDDGGKDAGEDAPKEAGPDGSDGGQGEDGGGDAGNDAGKDGGEDDKKKDAGGEDASAPPPPTNANQDERMLDQLEQAPTWQREEAKARAGARRVRGMMDK